MYGPVHTYKLSIKSQPSEFVQFVVCLFFLIYRTDDAFERNKKDVFKIKTTDLGPLKKLMWELKIIATYMYM